MDSSASSGGSLLTILSKSELKLILVLETGLHEGQLEWFSCRDLRIYCGGLLIDIIFLL